MARLQPPEFPPEFRLEDWFPMSPIMGPPLPKWLALYWPWYQEVPPPGGYLCPYCGDTFDTYDAWIGHIQSEHPLERIPIEITWT